MSQPAAKVPASTYRVQMHGEFGFQATADIAQYLSDLGVSHLYASPYLQAAPGSTHGYDVLDHTRPNSELGGEDGHRMLCEALGRAGLGQVLDIVPNHMSISSRGNAWWWDVLENGPASRYAAYFDVDWHPPETKLLNTVLMPILSDHYGRVVEAGEIQLERHGGVFTLKYFDHVMPVAPRTLDDLLNSAAERAESDSLAFLADAFGRLPPATAIDRASVSRRHRDKVVLMSLLEQLCQRDAAASAAIDEVIAELNASPDEIDVLIERQNYRLAFWRTAGQELDYRRFFDINTLVSLRMEDDKVFADTHVKILAWLKEGVLDGVRVDHPDGLRDPQAYFARLQQAAPEAWIVAEKILEVGEQLPPDWAVAGTTGYDFLNQLGGIYVHPDGEQLLSAAYQNYTGVVDSFPSIVHDKKLLVLRDLFGSDLNRLTELLGKVCERNRRYRDATRRELRAVLREIIACFPVYRSYVRTTDGHIDDNDTQYINQAVDDAKQIASETDAALFEFVRDLLLLRVRGDLEGEFVMRFQQLSGPVMAKGVEDTAFYNYNRLVSLNEVGGDPGHWGNSLDDFHRQCAFNAEHWPSAMLASTTHDTKRSEDVRARLALLSEIPDRWQQAVDEWTQLTDRHLQAQQPDRNARWLLFQIMVGAWPLKQDRLQAYMEKATREAKTFTSWTTPQPSYDEAVKSFIAAIYADGDFLASVERFVAPLVEPGRINSLSQTLIKLTAPGVPDIYQGTELWALSLVDPDNRRPVDFEARRRLLAESISMTPEKVLARMDEGLPKLWLMQKVLHLRREQPDWFNATARYTPLAATGQQAAQVVSFARGERVVAIAPRWPIARAGEWGDTRIELPAGQWINLFTPEQHAAGSVGVADVLRRFPVALLTAAR